MNRSDHASARHAKRRERFAVKYRKTNVKTKVFNTGQTHEVEQPDGTLKTVPLLLPYQTSTWVRKEPKAPSRRDAWRSR